MKIKDFKEQLKSEQYDIPDVLDNIREVAYKKEFNKPKERKVYFKITFSLAPVLCLLVLGIFLFPKLSTGSDPFSPQSAEFASPEDDVSNNQEEKETPSPSETPESGNIQLEDVTNEYDIAEYVLYSAYFKNEEIPSSLLEEITLPNNCSESHECLVKFNDSSLYFLTDEQFDYLSNYLTNNPEVNIEEIYDVLSTKFNITEDNLYTIFNAYVFINEKKGNE